MVFRLSALVPRVRASLSGSRHATTAATAPKPDMFCYQCEQTSNGEGCKTVGVCGKTPETSALQDLLVYRLKGLAGWAVHAHNAGLRDPAAASFFQTALFSTLTNVNFDNARFLSYLAAADSHVARLKEAVVRKGAPALATPDVPWFGAIPHPFACDSLPSDATALEDYGRQVGIASRLAAMGDDKTLLGLHELVTYGVKGSAAYAAHASRGGCVDDELNLQLMRGFAFTCTEAAADASKVLQAALAVGATNLGVMGLLEQAHTGLYGHPSPTKVSTVPRAGKALLVSGHDLTDLSAILEQTKGTGISVYTHGEMLPAHGYPKLRAHEHLAGHYGGAWYRQKHDFAAFPGAILMTTNCVLHPPSGSHDYSANLFTAGETGVPGVAHVGDGREFGAPIKRALELPGWTPADVAKAKASGAPTHTVGFGREATLGAAPALLDAIKAGKLKHLFLIGGCDGSEGSRRHYAQVASLLPPSSLILTLGCAKFRLLGHDYGTVPGTELPRLLDMGQCNVRAARCLAPPPFALALVGCCCLSSLLAGPQVSPLRPTASSSSLTPLATRAASLSPRPHPAPPLYTPPPSRAYRRTRTRQSRSPSPSQRPPA
jgi:hydroxylamine reductase